MGPSMLLWFGSLIIPGNWELFQNTTKKRDSNRANLEEGEDSSASSKVPRLESGDDNSQT